MTEPAPSSQSLSGGQGATEPALSRTRDVSPGEAPLGPVELEAELARIYQAELAFVWNRLRRLGVAERDLEDKVHDVFVIVHRHLARFDRTRPLRPWLAGISVRVAIAHHRLAHERRMVLTEVEAVDDRDGPDLLVEEREKRDLVLAALDELPIEQRTVLVLKELDGFTMPEIEELLGVPLNTLYSRLRLARLRFSSAVQHLRGQVGAP